ncbi:hypothetical protein MYX82_01660 [Acidobacteria bacterium AH-259-D05]|nr:hypothetical protein [Acidobacteria bacterium AH-259-D05]
MPYLDPDPGDPHDLVGVEVPAGEEAHVEMAYAFAEEFTRLGFTQEQLLGLFRNPFYRSAYGARRILGEKRIKSIIQEVFQVWGRVRLVDREAFQEPLVQLEVSTQNEERGES